MGIAQYFACLLITIFQERIQGGAPSKIGKKLIFWHKIVIFHTKYPKNFRASLRNWKKYYFFGVKSWFFTRNTHKISVPPFAWCNFFKCAPPNFKSWILPCIQICIYLQVGSDYFWMVIAFFDFACLLITISGFACCHSDFIWKIYDHNNFNFCSRWLILL